MRRGKKMALKNKIKLNCGLYWGCVCSSPLPQLPAAPLPSPGERRRPPSSLCLGSGGLWQQCRDCPRVPRGTSGLWRVFGG